MVATQSKLQEHLDDEARQAENDLVMVKDRMQSQMAQAVREVAEKAERDLAEKSKTMKKMERELTSLKTTLSDTESVRMMLLFGSPIMFSSQSSSSSWH